MKLSKNFLGDLLMNLFEEEPSLDTKTEIFSMLNEIRMRLVSIYDKMDIPNDERAVIKRMMDTLDEIFKEI